MKWTMVGRLVDAGDLEEGRGVRVRVGDKTVTVIGLDQSMVQWLAKSFGEDVAIGFDGAFELRQRLHTQPGERHGS